MIRTFTTLQCKACNQTGRITRDKDLPNSYNDASYNGIDAGKIYQGICLGCNGVGLQSLLVGEVENLHMITDAESC